MFKYQLILPLIKFKRWKRRYILLFIDSLNIILCIFLSSLLSDIKIQNSNFLIYPLILIATLTIFIFTDHYKGLTRYEDTTLIYRLGARNLLVFVFLLTISYILKNDYFIDPKTIFLYFCFLYSSTLSISFERFSNSQDTALILDGSVITPTLLPRDLYSKSPTAMAIKYDGILILFSN